MDCFDILGFGGGRAVVVGGEDFAAFDDLLGAAPLFEVVLGDG